MQPEANRSQSLFMALIAGLVAVSLAACSSATSSPSNGGGAETSATDGKNDSFLTGGKADGLHEVEPGSAKAEGILELVNTADYETLDDDVSLDRRAAQNIVLRALDSEIETLEQLDAIAWVGPRAFGKLYEYAGANGYFPESANVQIHGVTVGSRTGWAILQVANYADFETLDETIGLDVRAATGIEEARASRRIEGLDELDEISWVSARAFGKIADYVEARGWVKLPDGEPVPETYDDPNHEPTAAEFLGKRSFAAGTLQSARYGSDGDVWEFEVDTKQTVKIDIWAGERRDGEDCRGFDIHRDASEHSPRWRIFEATIGLHTKDAELITWLDSQCGTKRTDGDAGFDYVVELEPGRYYITMRSPRIRYGWEWELSYGIEIDR